MSGVLSINRIKSCPFCGMKEHEYHLSVVPVYVCGARNLHMVACDCGAQGSEAPTEKLAIKYWNKRVES